MDIPDRALAARPERAVRRRQPASSRARDEGQSWQPISPDLTRNDPDNARAYRRPVTRDDIGAENYATIFAFAESPHEPGVLWAGSDDGLRAHLARRRRRPGNNVTPPDLPEWTLISFIEPSPHDAATAYVAATRYKLDDYRPYLYKTSDYGQTWTRITDGIPDDDFTRVIREDPDRPGLLYAGTETGAVRLVRRRRRPGSRCSSICRSRRSTIC